METKFRDDSVRHLRLRMRSAVYLMRVVALYSISDSVFSEYEVNYSNKLISSRCEAVHKFRKSFNTTSPGAKKQQHPRMKPPSTA